MNYIPQAIRETLLASLNDAAFPAFGQAASIDPNGTSQIRTVHFRFLPTLNTVGFSTNSNSRKWKELQANAKLSGCYFNLKTREQFRWVGSCELLEVKTAAPHMQPLLQEMWQLVSQSVKEVYWHQWTNTPYDAPLPKNANPQMPTPSFAHIICKPAEWDYYKMVTLDYRTHIRIGYLYKDNHWIATPLRPTDGIPLEAR